MTSASSRPTRPAARQFAASVIDHVPVGEDLFELWLTAPEGVSAMPGQFVHVRCGGALLRRPFSVYRTRPGAWALLYRVVGKGTRWLSSVRAGDALDILGPLGNSFEAPKPTERILLVGGGVGMAPLAHFAETFGSGNGLRAIAGFRSKAHVSGLKPFLETGVPLVVRTEDGSEGRPGRVTEDLADTLRSGAITRLLTCGPEAMMRAIAAIASRHGVSCEISVERPMGCGVGVCLGCIVPVTGPDGTRRYERACQEGPVFAAEAIAW